MSEYTPSTAQVRDSYISAWREQNTGQSRAEFYRWLAEVRAAERERIAQAIGRRLDNLGHTMTPNERHGLRAALRIAQEEPADE